MLPKLVDLPSFRGVVVEESLRESQHAERDADRVPQLTRADLRDLHRTPSEVADQVVLELPRSGDPEVRVASLLRTRNDP